MENYCINCKFFLPREVDFSHELSLCKRKGKPNPVTGEMKYPYCHDERTYATGTCADGVHFQPKEENNHAE
ncbi:UNVERIFIED_CONTAM: hypothetical protein [Bacteriophage sp.]